MQDHPVRLVGDRREQRAFGGRRILEQRQRLVAVASEHDVVEAFCPAVAEVQLHPAGDPAHAAHRRRAAGALAEITNQSPHVAARSPFDRPPLRPVLDVDKTVVGKKAQEGDRRETPYLAARTGPDRRGHRVQVVFTEGPTQAVTIKKGIQRHRGRGRGLDRPPGNPVEAQDTRQHAPEAGVEQVAALAEQAVQVAPGIFQPTAIERGRERHVGVIAAHPQVLEQRAEQRVVGPVEDHEAGVHLDRAVLILDQCRVGVAAEVVPGLEQAHRRRIAQQPGGNRPAHPAAHHCHPSVFVHKNALCVRVLLNIDSLVAIHNLNNLDTIAR